LEKTCFYVTIRLVPKKTVRQTKKFI